MIAELFAGKLPQERLTGRVGERIFAQMRLSDGREFARAAKDTSLLQDSIVCELDALALKTAAMASAANALLRPNVAFSAEVLERYLPPADNRFLTLLSLYAGAHGNSPVVDRLQAFIFTLDEATDGLASLFADIHMIGPERASVLHRDRLSRQWQCIAFSAAETIDETKRALRWNLPRLYWQNACVLASMLRSAANGFAPCVDSSGRLFEPPLPQQRRWPRVSVLQECTVLHEGESISALLRDASVGGLGLDRLPYNFKRDTRVSVVMATGRRLGGRIVWSNCPRSGVMLDHKLEQDDPLLRG